MSRLFQRTPYNPAVETKTQRSNVHSGKSLLPVLVSALLAAQVFAPSVSAQTGARAPFKLTRPDAKLAQDAPLQQWVDATKPPKVVLLCIHGLGLHKGSYDAFGKEMSKYGIAVIAIDMRGFGAWLESGKNKTVDFDGSLADIESRLKKVHADYPGVPVVMLGESMGGAIALRATALYPELISGSISSVPSGDRYNEMGQGFKIGMHVLLGGGMNKPMNIGDTIVKQATKKDDLRETWSQDPDGKMNLTPAELMHFQSFMKENFDAAKTITAEPVLFIQGVSDKLVRPAGTWQLYDSLATPKRQLVLSQHGEHLIFEDSQFSNDDLSFVRTWIDKNVVALNPSAVASRKQQPAVADSIRAQDVSSDAVADPASPAVATSPTSTGSSNAAAAIPSVSSTAASGGAPAVKAGADSRGGRRSPRRVVTARADKSTSPPQTSRTVGAIAGSVVDGGGLNYWIELYRSGKSYRCNNKRSFNRAIPFAFTSFRKRLVTAMC